jgi:hypothetical protein
MPQVNISGKLPFLFLAATFLNSRIFDNNCMQRIDNNFVTKTCWKENHYLTFKPEPAEKICNKRKKPL